MTSTTTQIISPTWIAPVIPDGALLLDHSLVIEGSRITALLPQTEALARFPDAPNLKLEGHLVTPGFVNVHGHAAMTLLRGIADDREMMDWLTNWIWPIEGELVSEQFVYDGTRLAAMEMIMGGTTCAADTYFFPEAASRALTQMNFRAQVGMPVIQFANAWARNEEDHIHKGLAFRDSIKNSSLLTTAFSPHSPYSVSDSGFNKIQLYSEQLDLAVHLHLHETATEVTDSLRDIGVRPIERMNKLGILSPSLQAVHMTQLRDDEIELLAVNGVQVAHCPESNMKLASGFCPVEKLRAKNINVAIGTDGAASNNDLDMIQEVRSASLLSKATIGDATSLSAQTCLAMITINGARFLGLEDQIGSLEPGKLADITAIDLSHPSFQPIYNPISQLVYTASARDVSHVWIGGKRVMDNRQLPEADTESILAATRQWQKKISAVSNKQP